MLFGEAMLQSLEFWVTVGLLVALLLGGAVVLSVTDRWRKRQSQSTREGIESLSLYREMYDDGELDEKEYRVIRDRFARELGAKPAGAAPAKGAGEAVGANLGDSPGPPPEPPDKAPPIS